MSPGRSWHNYVALTVFAAAAAAAGGGGIPGARAESHTVPNSTGGLLGVGTAAAHVMSTHVNGAVQVLDNVRKDFLYGNVELPHPKGSPGADSELSRFMAQSFRNSYRQGGFWFGHKDGGYMGYAATASEYAAGSAQYTYKAEAELGLRQYFDANANFRPSAVARTKVSVDYTITNKLWYLATMEPGNLKEAAWVPQVSFTSGALNYFYTQKMYDASSALVGWGLQGIDHEIIKRDLANTADVTTKMFVTVDGTTKMLASSNATQAITVLNPACDDAACANLDQTVRYLLVDAAVAADPVIAGAASATGSSFTVGSDTYYVASDDFNVNTYMTGVKVYATSRISADHAAAMREVARNRLMTTLKPMSDDLAAMKSMYATSTLPAAYPVKYPAFGSRLQQYWAAVWRTCYSLGGLWLGMADNSYIGYAAGAQDVPLGKSQYTYIWGEGVDCPAITDCPAGSSADKCAAVTNGNCRRFWEVGLDLVPTKAYRNKKDYYVDKKYWFTSAVASGAPGWYVAFGTTIELPTLIHNMPIIEDGQVKAVAIYQLDIGHGSSCNRVLQQLVGSNTGLTMFVMSSTGELVATGGEDANLWSHEDSALVKAASYAGNNVISTVATAIGTNVGSTRTGTAGGYDYVVVPLDSALTANLGWVAVSARKTPASARDASKPAETKPAQNTVDANNVDIVTLVFACLILILSMFHLGMFLKSLASQEHVYSTKNPSRASVLEMKAGPKPALV